MKSTAVDESLSSMNQQFCSRENQLLQILEAGLILNYLSPYAAPIIVVPHKAPPGNSLTKTKKISY